MFNQNTKTFWISLGLAFFSVFLTYSYLQDKKTFYQKEYMSTQTVVIAKEDISQMQTILDNNVLDVVERPSQFVDPGSFSDPERIIGLVAATPIKKGEQITATRMIRPGPETGIAHQVAPNKRAFTLPVSKDKAVSNLIKPGDRVDVIVVREIGTGQSKITEAKTVLQDIVILSAGKRIVNVPNYIDEERGDYIDRVNISRDTDFNTIALELTPKQVQIMAYFSQVSAGGIFLSLRNPVDSKKLNSYDIPIMNTRNIDRLGGSRKPATGR